MDTIRQKIQELVCLNYNNDFQVIAEQVLIYFDADAVQTAYNYYLEIQKDLYDFEKSA